MEGGRNKRHQLEGHTRPDREMYVVDICLYGTFYIDCHCLGACASSKEGLEGVVLSLKKILPFGYHVTFKGKLNILKFTKKAMRNCIPIPPPTMHACLCRASFMPLQFV